MTVSATNRGGADTGATAAVNNEGTFTKSGSAATSQISVALNNSGIIDVQAGTLNLTGATSNTGTLEADGGTLFVSGSVGGSGLISAGGLLPVGGASSSIDVNFAAASTGTLRLDHALNYAGHVEADANDQDRSVGHRL